MVHVDSQLSTGLAGLDRVLRGLIPGDNIVWHVDTAEDYDFFARPYCASACSLGKRLVYFHFAKRELDIPKDIGVEVHHLHPEVGFETFINEIHDVIQANGKGGYYLFDCLSELAVDWYSDQMLGNFFMLTCPYLYDMETITYFALLRNSHSFHATTPINETAQILLDVYRYRDRLFIQPQKVLRRYSPTMYMLHAFQDGQFQPITDSATVSEILTSVPRLRLESSHYRLGIWNRAFLEAEEAMIAARSDPSIWPQVDHDLSCLLRMVISHDERLLGLARRHLTLADMLEVGKRMIGTGLIGGKAVGMLLGRAILKQADPRWQSLLEAHDSFFVGSDVFYTFLVRNGIWRARQKQRDPEHFLEQAEEARQRMLLGSFPTYIQEQFEGMLDYFGQSPIIVRSSSLLEDNFGNAFAGKYESIFCVNQGSRQKRTEDFISAVRTIYAGAMSEKALTYRARRGILDRDEQMGLLIQRVSGTLYEDLYYPHVAGVGLSFNPYVWSPIIEPEAGMLRLVFGLGTRAVDRSDDDYTRIVALNAPGRRPEANFDQVRQYAQHKVDILDLNANQFVSREFSDVAQQSPGLPVEMFAALDETLMRLAGENRSRNIFPWVLTFDRLFQATDFIHNMRQMLQTLQRAYDYPVDVEFTANFLGENQYKINLVQCRPLQVQGGGMITDPPKNLSRGDVVFRAHGATIGHSRIGTIDRIIYVVPAVYGRMEVKKRYSISRLIGKLTHLKEPCAPETVMMLGPGRWGTSTPTLGVPVSFADINTVSILGEIVAMSEDVIPDVSLGTHFFNELVEMDILYLALFPGKEGNELNRRILEESPDELLRLVPEAEEWADAVRVIDANSLPGRRAIKLNANSITQKVVCYLE